MSGVASPASAKEALGMLRSAMGYLAAADAAQLAAGTQAQCLQALEQVSAMGTAARASILAAFTAGQGYCADADYSPRAWLIRKTRVTRGAAVAHTAWVRRAAAHPLIAAAPGGLASFLRRRQLGARLAGPSLPLDVGYSETISANQTRQPQQSLRRPRPRRLRPKKPKK